MKSPIMLALGAFILILGLQGLYIRKYTLNYNLSAPVAEKNEKVKERLMTFAPTNTTTYGLITIGGCVLVYAFISRK